MIETRPFSVHQASSEPFTTSTGDEIKVPYEHLRIDPELGQQFLARDPKAWTTLIEQRHEFLINKFMGKGLSRQDANDVAQTIWTNAWAHLESYDSQRGEIGAWLNSIGSHAFIDAIRRQTKERLRSDFSNIPEGEVPSAEDVAVVNETEYEIVQTFETLPPTMKKACQLRFIEGFSNPEIATLHEKKLSTVEMQTFRGRKILQYNLQPVLDDLIT